MSAIAIPTMDTNRLLRRVMPSGQAIRLVSALSLFLLTAPPTLAQTSTGTISGTVTDPSGAVVPDARVIVRNMDTNVKREVTSNEVGQYVFPLLQPGTYQVAVSHSDFKTFQRSGITLQVNQQARIDVRLEQGQILEVVQVTEDAPLVQQDSSTLGTVIDEHQVVELPLNGRNFYQLTYLVPGAVPGAENSQISGLQGGTVSVNGMREQSNNFMLDGVDNNWQFNNQVSLPPPLDSVREFKVQSGNYDAEFGTRAGAQVNFATRSGTNRFRGSVYEFHRNAVLDAKNFFDSPVQDIPKFIRNQFGFSFGGPVFKDKTFFFGNYEGLRERKSITRIATVPDTALINGDFSSLPVPILNPETGQPFSGNVMPPESMDPIGAAIARFFPVPNTNQPGGNLISTPAQRINLDQFVVRLDHLLSQSNSLFGRYAFSEDDFLMPFDGTNIPGFGSLGQFEAHNLVLGWIHSFSPSLLNELKIGFNRFRGDGLHENVGNDVSSQLGIQGLSNNPQVVGFPGTEVVGFDSMATSIAFPFLVRDNLYQLVEGLSWHKGKHNIKIGGDLRYLRENLFTKFFGRGSFIYTGGVTGHPVGDLLVGRPTFAIASPAESGSVAGNFRNWSYGLYFHDDFKVSTNFTLNYGVRYEYTQPPVDVLDRLWQPKLLSSEALMIQCGTEGVPRGCWEADKNNFAPRIGFAWSPFAERMTVVRAGYGIFYDVGHLTRTFLVARNPPNIEIKRFLMPASLSNPFQGGQNVPLTVGHTFPNIRDAYAQHWSLNIQQSLWRDILMEVGYAGSKGTKLLATVDPNQPRPGGSQRFRAYDEVLGVESGASSTYHSLWLRGERRIGKGVTFLASYNFAKSIDDSSALLGSEPQDSYNRREERGLSNFDNRHRFVLNHIWELPVGRDKRFMGNLSPWWNGVLGGWQFAGILVFRSARPFTAILPGTDDSNTMNQGTDRPHLIGNPHLSNPDPARWVDPKTFKRPQGTFGNAGRNILRGPGFHSVDLALMKQWSFSETSRLQFRAEFFNSLNHPNFHLPVGDWNSENFGRVQSAQDSRQIQFGLRFEF